MGTSSSQTRRIQSSCFVVPAYFFLICNRILSYGTGEGLQMIHLFSLLLQTQHNFFHTSIFLFSSQYFCMMDDLEDKIKPVVKTM